MHTTQPSVNNLTLYRFEADPTQFCLSTFVNKLDALLTFSGLDDVKYQKGTMSQAPRGKFPFIELNGVIIPDSEFAYNSCISKGLVECLDRKAGLNDKEMAISLSYQALVERSLDEMMAYERWIDNWYVTRDKFLADIPSIIRPAFGYLFVYRVMNSRMWHSGIGRYTSQERQKNLEDTINALASIVPKFGYIMGKATPTRVDASVFGFLTSVLISAESSPKVITELHKYPHILEYRNRLALDFWPERKPIQQE